MKKSNIILIGQFAFIIIMLMVLSLSFKPEYANTVRNISGTFTIVSIKGENLTPEKIHFSHALDKKDTYIYYEKKYKKDIVTNIANNIYNNEDTLFMQVERLEMKGLYLHLKGIEELYLNGKKIDID